MFRVGQKVVCVDALYFEHFLSEGEIYHIHSIGTDYGNVWLRLCEVLPEEGGGFAARRFRPIVERKTDISIFKAMLTPAGKKERVS